MAKSPHLIGRNLAHVKLELSDIGESAILLRSEGNPSDIWASEAPAATVGSVAIVSIGHTAPVLSATSGGSPESNRIYYNFLLQPMGTMNADS